MRSFDELIDEAQAADVTGWGFGWLDGRATEERPGWGYTRLLAARLATVRSALDIDTGGGEVIAEAAVLPERMCVTESWPPNAQRARELLTPRGVEVHETRPGGALPVPDRTFDLVSSRHPVRPDWTEIHRVLAVPRPVAATRRPHPLRGGVRRAFVATPHRSPPVAIRAMIVSRPCVAARRSGQSGLNRDRVDDMDSGKDAAARRRGGSTCEESSLSRQQPH